MRKTLAVLRGAENLLHRFLSSLSPAPASIFDDHLEAKGVSQAWDRRGRQHGNLRACEWIEIFLQLGGEDWSGRNRVGVGPSLDT